jgi:hypothetical protein
MRTSLIIACLAICGCHYSVEAQSPLPLKSNPAKSEITLYNGSEHMTGALFLPKDSSILVANSLDKEDYVTGNYEVAELYIDDIKLISPERRGGLIEGALLGAVVGMAAGALTARIINRPLPEISPSYYQFDPWGLSGFNLGSSGNGMTYALCIPAGAIAGAVTGAIIGSIKIEIPLNGSMENYKNKKKKLGRSTIKYNGSPKY